MNAIANRIDQGYNIDVRAAAPEDEDESGESDSDGVRDALRTIVALSPKLRFINVTGEPILSLPETTEEDPTV